MLPGRTLAFDDFHAFARGVLQDSLELHQSLRGDRAAMEEKLLVLTGEVTREELPEHLLVDVLLYGAASAPGKATAHQQAGPISRLQLDDLQAIELDEVLQGLPLGEAVRAHDFLELRAVQHEPGDEEQARVGDDLLLLGEGELVDRRRAVLGPLEDFA